MSVTPDFIGQVYKDTSNGNLWRANSTTPGDWTLELQNCLIKWNPTTVILPNYVMFSAWENASVLPGVTSLILSAATLEDMDLENPVDLVDFNCPNLVSLTGGTTGLYFTGSTNLTTASFPLLTTAGGITINSHAALTTLNLVSFVSCLGELHVETCDLLASLDLASLTNVDKLNVSSNSSLSSLNVPLWVPKNGKNHNFTGNALLAASVNMILARGVANAGFISGKIDISGGTNAAPTGQGILDKATLNARLAGLAVTN